MNKTVVVLMSLMLLTSTATALSGTSLAQVNLNTQKQKTMLTLEMNGCTNTLTCNASWLVGDQVTFKGVLTTEDGKPVRDGQINIIKFIPKPELVVIASGVTGIDGDFQLTWTADITTVEKPMQDVTHKKLSENVAIYADFPGNDQFAPSRSAKNTAIIEANELKTFVNSDKNLYKQGDSVLVFVAFLDSNDKFVDPDSIRAVVNDHEVQVEKKKTGSYTLTLPNLAKEHTQLLIQPKKVGYNLDNGFLTIIVEGLH